MSEIKTLIVKLSDPKHPVIQISTILNLKELKNAIHFFEERKRKNIKGGRPKKVEKWLNQFIQSKNYFLFDDLDNAYRNGNIGRDSYYRILRKLKNLGWDRKILDKLYEFTLILRKLMYLICNYEIYLRYRKVVVKSGPYQ
ncbi:MAG: hypothetical protein ACTSYB_17060 [Candidatus Helarchaeota archaeon]